MSVALQVPSVFYVTVTCGRQCNLLQLLLEQWFTNWTTCSVWCVVCGVWCVVCGVWCVLLSVGDWFSMVLAENNNFTTVRATSACDLYHRQCLQNK